MPSSESSSPSAPTKVLIVDDHTMFAEGIALLLAKAPDLSVVGIAATTAEAKRLVAERKPEVVTMDFRLPDGDGVETTVEILKARPKTRVLMLSGETSASLFARAVEAGCSGFISKSQSSHEIVAGVRAASRGESIVPTSVLTSLLTHLSSPQASTMHQITAREIEVLKSLSSGISTEGIAENLFLSVHTVRNHIRNILSKLGAHSKLEAVAIATREGIITLDDRKSA